MKRKNYEDSELFTQKYSRDVKRQKLNDETINYLMNWLVENCPAKSGSDRVVYIQYKNDSLLYDDYYHSTHPPEVTIVHFNTFIKYKKWLRVRRINEYFGQFDCQKCIQLKRMCPLLSLIQDEYELNKIRLKLKNSNPLKELLYHRIEYFHRSINIKSAEINSEVSGY